MLPSDPTRFGLWEQKSKIVKKFLSIWRFFYEMVIRGIWILPHFLTFVRFQFPALFDFLWKIQFEFSWIFWHLLDFNLNFPAFLTIVGFQFEFPPALFDFFGRFNLNFPAYYFDICGISILIFRTFWLLKDSICIFPNFLRFLRFLGFQFEFPVLFDTWGISISRIFFRKVQIWIKCGKIQIPQIL